jgi:predicted lipid-binding transport protein (Tim44 family)
MCATTASRQPKWRILLALFFGATIALAPAIADARGGSSYGGRSSSMGSRGSRTYEPNGAQPLSRSVTPAPEAPRQPGLAPTMPSPAYGGGSFFQRHPFLTGLAGGLIGSWLFGHAGYAAGEAGASGASMLGTLLQLLIIGLIIYFVVRLVRGWAFANGARGGGAVWPGSAGAAGAAAARGRGRDINVGDTDLTAFQSLHAAVQEAWSAGDLGGLRRLMTPEMLSYFSEELTRNASQGVQNIVSNVELLQGDLKEAWEEGDLQYATAYLRWRADDYVVRIGRSPGDPDWLVSGDPRRPVEAEEMWTFVRRRGGQWLLSAIQQI